MADFVFGYASLADRPGARPAELRGFRRRWNVAMDNSVDLPGYKHYLDPDGSRPAVFVTYLNLEPDEGSSVNGVLFPIEADELPLLGARERNYEMREVTEWVEPPVADGRVLAYVGTADARARYESAAARGVAVVDRAYLEVVRSSFAALGGDALRRFDASTDSPAVPVRALRRVDATIDS